MLLTVIIFAIIILTSIFGMMIYVLLTITRLIVQAIERLEKALRLTRDDEEKVP